MSKNRANILAPRPPSYVSKATLAAELDMSETTVDQYVKSGLLPKPIRRGGSVRWCWAEVDAALRSENGNTDDQFMAGLGNV
jgi:predicted DNA-binding transcriptional regulator AlpA